jgi:hypothetical protein
MPANESSDKSPHSKRFGQPRPLACGYANHIPSLSARRNIERPTATPIENEDEVVATGTSNTQHPMQQADGVARGISVLVLVLEHGTVGDGFQRGTRLAPASVWRSGAREAFGLRAIYRRF